MARSGTAFGTVVWWDDARGGAVIESAELSGTCWAAATAVVHSTAGDGLRAGQVVQFEWAEPGAAGHPFQAVRVEPREDLQASLGG